MCTVIAGFGSPNGDDQAGWRVAAMLKRRYKLPAHVVVVSEATQLLDELPGCSRLIVVDACRSDREIGSVTRLRWPDPRIARQHGPSTHGVSVSQALELAERLHVLPPQVDIFAIEIRGSAPGSNISPTVLQAVLKVEAEICGELLQLAQA